MVNEDLVVYNGVLVKVATLFYIGLAQLNRTVGVQVGDVVHFLALTVSNGLVDENGVLGRSRYEEQGHVDINGTIAIDVFCRCRRYVPCLVCHEVHHHAKDIFCNHACSIIEVCFSVEVESCGVGAAWDIFVLAWVTWVHVIGVCSSVAIHVIIQSVTNCVVVEVSRDACCIEWI